MDAIVRDYIELKFSDHYNNFLGFLVTLEDREVDFYVNRLHLVKMRFIKVFVHIKNARIRQQLITNPITSHPINHKLRTRDL